jgi:hypothetical protein
MMKKFFLLFAVSFVVFFNAVPDLKSQSILKQEQKPGVEPWYLLLGLGYSDISYPSGLQELIDILKESSEVTHLPLNINIGVYWPMNNAKTLIGFIISADGDMFDYQGGNMQINSYLIGGSLISHITDYIGKGIYLRGDAGISFISVSSSSSSGSSSDPGFGLRVGGGYELPISKDETRIQFDIGYTYRNIEGDSYGSLGFGLGLLF